MTAPIDIERLVQWALAPGRAGGFKWRGDVALSFDGGLTARPRHKPRGSWALVEAGAATATGTRPAIALAATADPDAAAVAAAIAALPSDEAALVLFHGRRRTRPAWTERRARLVPRWAAPGRPKIANQNPKRRTQQYCVLDLAVEIVTTEASRGTYAKWQQALATLAAGLAGAGLLRWRVAPTMAAPGAPWRDALEPRGNFTLRGRSGPMRTPNLADLVAEKRATA